MDILEVVYQVTLAYLDTLGREFLGIAEAVYLDIAEAALVGTLAYQGIRVQASADILVDQDILALESAGTQEQTALMAQVAFRDILALTVLTVQVASQDLVVTQELMEQQERLAFLVLVE